MNEAKREDGGARLADRELLNELVRVARLMGFGTNHIGDELIGWQGTAGKDPKNEYQCEFCFVEHRDVAELPHTEACPIPQFRALVALAKSRHPSPGEKR